jgi:hypothetical protein
LGSVLFHEKADRRELIDKDCFLDAARRLASKDRNGLADPEDMAVERGIRLYEVTELVRRFRTRSIGLPFRLASCGPTEPVDS